MKSSFGAYDNAGNRIDTPYTDQQINDALAKDTAENRQLKRQLIEQQVCINNLEMQIGQLQTQLQAITPATIAFVVPDTIRENNYYLDELKIVIDLVCACVAAGLDWEIIKARILLTEDLG